MSEAEIFNFIQDSVWILIKIVSPYLLVALVVGMLVSILQTITSIQEQALVFVPKLLVFFGLVFYLLPNSFVLMKNYWDGIIDKIINIQ